MYFYIFEIQTQAEGRRYCQYGTSEMFVGRLEHGFMDMNFQRNVRLLLYTLVTK